jgi:hypothetical protein
MESRDREDHGSRPAKVKMFVRLYLKKKSWAWWHMPVIPMEAEIGGLQLWTQGWQGKSMRLNN